MALPVQVLSLYFIKFLATLNDGVYVANWKLKAVNNILKVSSLESQIRTIIYFGNADNVETVITALSGIPKIVSTEPLGDIKLNDVTAGLNYGFNRNIIFIAIGEIEHKTTLNHINRAFDGIQGTVYGIFIIPRSARKTLYLNEHFDWCWRRGFANVIVLKESTDNPPQLQVYTYNRFPVMRVIQSDFRPGKMYFKNKYQNLYGHRVRTPAQYDPPRVFEFYDPNKGRVVYKGYAAEMFKAFLEKINGVLEIVQVHNSSTYNIPGIIEQLSRDDVDLAMNPFLPSANSPGVRTSYPIKMMQWCVLVPFSGEIEAYEYFLRPFRPIAWLISIVALFYLSFAKGFSDRLQHSHGHGRTQFGKAFLLMLRLMLYLPVPYQSSVHNFHVYRAFYLITITVLGFILSNLYLATLTSFLTKMIFEQQLDTLEVMVARNIEINAIGYEIPIILKNEGLAKGFADLLVPRNATAFVDELLQLKMHQAYIAREDILGFVLSQQRHLLRPLFHIANEGISTIPVAFLMPTHSQFEFVLNRFILRVASAGLTDKWFQDAMTDGLRAGILHVRKQQSKSPCPLSLQHFQLAWYVLAGGSVLALLSFIIENLKRVTSRIHFFVYFY